MSNGGFLQKMSVRPERYQIGLRLGFFYSNIYTLHLRVLFQLFKGCPASLSITSIIAFCDFYDKRSSALFELRRLNLLNLSARIAGHEESGCLQLVRSRPVTFCDAQKTLRKPSSCIIATALPYFLNTCSYFLLQRTTGFQLNFFWFPLVSVLGSWRFRGLSLLRNLSYLSFLSLVSFLELSSVQPYKVRFLYLVFGLLKLLFSALFSYSFILKQKLDGNN